MQFIDCLIVICYADFMDRRISFGRDLLQLDRGICLALCKDADGFSGQTILRIKIGK